MKWASPKRNAQHLKRFQDQLMDGRTDNAAYLSAFKRQKSMLKMQKEFSFPRPIPVQNLTGIEVAPVLPHSYPAGHGVKLKWLLDISASWQEHLVGNDPLEAIDPSSSRNWFHCSPSSRCRVHTSSTSFASFVLTSPNHLNCTKDTFQNLLRRLFKNSNAKRKVFQRIESKKWLLAEAIQICTRWSWSLAITTQRGQNPAIENL